MSRGYVHVYTGDGKGKTTAALGLALRAAGAGLNVMIIQFMKTGDTSEMKALKRYADRITIVQYGRSGFIHDTPSQQDIAAARDGLEAAQAAIDSGRYQMLILEEANVAVSCGLITEHDLLAMITRRPDPLEIVITGRYATAGVIEAADLVTEMREVKHYFHRGVPARTGIEK